MTEETLFSKADRFRGFLESTDQKGNIRSHVSGLLQSLLAGPQALEVPAKPNVFDVGCGEGTMTAFLVGELNRFIPDTNLIAVDPSKAMTDLCRQRIVEGQLLPENRTQFITQEWWNRSDGNAPPDAIKNGPGFLSFAIHAHYYAADVKAAVASVEKSLASEGVAFFISQSPGSQMDQLRQKFSFSAETFRDQNQNTITTSQVSEGRTHKTDEFHYNSSLWFSPKVAEHIGLINKWRGQDVPQEEWGKRLEKAYTDSSDRTAFTRTVNVMEFILRDSLGSLDKGLVQDFSKELQEKLQGNKPRKPAEAPYLVITEGIVPVPASAAIVPQINYAIQSLKEQQSFGAQPKHTQLAM